MRRLAELMGWTGWVPSREILGCERLGLLLDFGNLLENLRLKWGVFLKGIGGENDFSLDGYGNIEGFGTQDLGILKSSG